MDPPHRHMDKLLDGLASIPQRISCEITLSLNTGSLGERGPHNSVDILVRSGGDAVKLLGEGVARALDEPLNHLET